MRDSHAMNAKIKNGADGEETASWDGERDGGRMSFRLSEGRNDKKTEENYKKDACRREFQSKWKINTKQEAAAKKKTTKQRNKKKGNWKFVATNKN